MTKEDGKLKKELIALLVMWSEGESSLSALDAVMNSS